MKKLNVMKNNSVIDETYVGTHTSNLDTLCNWLENEYIEFDIVEEDDDRDFYVDVEEGIFTITENI